MLAKLTLSGLVIVGACLCMPKAAAQTATAVIPFSGSIVPQCIFSNQTPGTLAASGNALVSSGGTGANAANVDLECNAPSTLSISNPVLDGTLPPSPLALIVTTAAAVLNASAVAACSSNTATVTVAASTCNGPSTLPILSLTPTPLTVHMTAQGSSSLPAGTYNYRVTLTANPN